MLHKIPDILPELMTCKETYGDVFRLLVGTRIFIIVSDPKIIQHVLNKHLSKGDTYKFFKAWIQDGLITSEGIAA